MADYRLNPPVLAPIGYISRLVGVSTTTIDVLLKADPTFPRRCRHAAARRLRAALWARGPPGRAKGPRLARRGPSSCGDDPPGEGDRDA